MHFPKFFRNCAEKISETPYFCFIAVLSDTIELVSRAYEFRPFFLTLILAMHKQQKPKHKQ